MVAKVKTNMAESSDWSGKLNNCALFDALRRSNVKPKSILSAKSIITVNDGKFYVWDSYNAALLVTNLKAMKSVSDLTAYQVTELDISLLVAVYGETVQ